MYRFPTKVNILENDLRQLVEQHGESDWKAIQQKYQLIGVDVKCQDLEERWYQLEPRRALQLFNKDQIQMIMEIGLNELGRKSRMMQAFAPYSTGQTKIQIAAAFLQTVKAGLMRFTRIFGRCKTEQRQFYRNMDFVTFKLFYRFIQLLPVPPPRKFSYDLLQLHELTASRAGELKRLLQCFSVFRYCSMAKQEQLYRQVVNTRGFHKIFQHMQYFQVIRNIANNTYTTDEQLLGKSPLVSIPIKQNRQAQTYMRLFNLLNTRYQKTQGFTTQALSDLVTDDQDKLYIRKCNNQVLETIIEVASTEFDSDIYKELFRQVDPEYRLVELMKKYPQLMLFINNAIQPKIGMNLE